MSFFSPLCTLDQFQWRSSNWAHRVQQWRSSHKSNRNQRYIDLFVSCGMYHLLCNPPYQNVALQTES